MSEKETPVPRGQNLQLSRRLEQVEISEWLDWMRRELSSSALDLPSEETSVLFAANAVRFADRIRSLCGRQPPHLRDLLIQSSLLHQCWARERKIRRNAESSLSRTDKLHTSQSVKFLRRWGEDSLMQAADGKRYVVKFPRADCDTALATEIICLELAKLMGLPAPKAAVIVVSPQLRREAGIAAGESHSQSNPLPCLGLVLAKNLKDHDRGWPDARPRGKEFLHRTCALVFNMLVLNSMPESQIPRVGNGYGSPIFLYHSRCMLDSNWSRFVKASYKDWAGHFPPIAHMINSVEQLEFWARRARSVDLNRLWELAFSLPPIWYGEHRIALANVLRKIDKRISDLPESIHYFVQQGYFPNINLETQDHDLRAS